uniref:Uncharacterized protein n=1 Tax=Salmonella phage vB_SE126_2P TaxID=3236704 RepID=A0AB39C3N0_9VIRU
MYWPYNHKERMPAAVAIAVTFQFMVSPFFIR